MPLAPPNGGIGDFFPPVDGAGVGAALSPLLCSIPEGRRLNVLGVAMPEEAAAAPGGDGGPPRPRKPGGGPPRPRPIIPPGGLWGGSPALGGLPPAPGGAPPRPRIAIPGGGTLAISISQSVTLFVRPCKVEVRRELRREHVIKPGAGPISNLLM